MPRPKNTVPTLLKHKPSGQARVQIDGRDVYLGRWGSQEAREAYARLVAEVGAASSALVQAAKHAAEHSRLSIAELLLLWLDWAEGFYVKRGRPTSHLATFTLPIRVLRELYASTPAAQFGPLALEAVRSQMEKSGIARKTVNQYLKSTVPLQQLDCPKFTTQLSAQCGDVRNLTGMAEAMPCYDCEVCPDALPADRRLTVFTTPHMTDVFSPHERSRVMRSVKSTGTAPERVVRSLVHRLGARFRLNRSDLPGKPDLVLPRRRAVIFVHGCFWHGHDCARGARRPRTCAAYWRKKIAGNRARDLRTMRTLRRAGWRVLVVWECETSCARQPRLRRRLLTFLARTAAISQRPQTAE